MISKADPNARTVHLQVAPACLEGYQSSKQNIEVGNTDNRTCFKWDENDDLRMGASRRHMLWLESREKNRVEEADDAGFLSLLYRFLRLESLQAGKVFQVFLAVRKNCSSVTGSYH